MKAKPARRGRPKKGAESNLDREAIVARALALAEEDGFERLTMRRLGAELGVDPMAIYRHVANKDALISAMVEAVFVRLGVDGTSQTHWRDRVYDWAKRYLAVIHAHPVFIREVAANRAAAETAAAASMAPLQDALAEGGLNERACKVVAHTLVDFLHGFSLARAAAAGMMGTEPGGQDDGLDLIVEGALALAARRRDDHISSA